MQCTYLGKHHKDKILGCIQFAYYFINIYIGQTKKVTYGAQKSPPAWKIFDFIWPDWEISKMRCMGSLCWLNSHCLTIIWPLNILPDFSLQEPSPFFIPKSYCALKNCPLWPHMCQGCSGGWVESSDESNRHWRLPCVWKMHYKCILLLRESSVSWQGMQRLISNSSSKPIPLSWIYFSF